MASRQDFTPIFHSSTLKLFIMASVKRLDRSNRKGFRIRFWVGQQQREIYIQGLSKAAERIAKNVGRYCDDLVQAGNNNVSPSSETIAWVESTEGSIRDKLVAWGLASPENPRLLTNEGRTVGGLLDSLYCGQVRF